MISMSQKQEVILRYFREGQSKKGIARDLCLAPKTVRKYIREHAAHRQALSEAEGSVVEQLVERLTEAPKYDSSGRIKKRLTNEVCQKIDAHLEQNRVKRSSGRHKQVLKKIDIHECLLKAGHQIGYTTVCNYIRGAEHRRQEAYIRQVGRQEKEPTEGLLRLSMYYQFSFRFCNVMRGNEKEHVERSVEYIRRKAFGLRDEFDSREQANA